VGLLIFAGFTYAQIPHYQYDRYGQLQPYYPGAIYPPYYPQPYYPQPYIAPGYDSANWNRDELIDTLSRNDQLIDSLTKQVRELTDQVTQLQAELSETRAQQTQTQAQITAATAPPKREPETAVVLVLKNGKRIESQGYAITNQSILILTPDGSRRFDFSALDLPATQKENLKRGIHFALPFS
jgi:hypothetical protein